MDGTGKATLKPSVPLEAGSHSIVLAYTSNAAFFSPSGATIVVNELASIYVLNPTASAALNVSGSSTATVPGTIQVASSSSSAIVLSGNSKLTASSIGLFGGSSVSGSSSFGVTPTRDAVAPADPLAGLPIPSAVGMTTYPAVNLGGVAVQTISPGIYPSISIGGSASLTLLPGVYVITGGGFSVNGGSTVTGSGVVIYNAGSNYNGGSGKSFGAFAVSGGGALNLMAMTTGAYAGIAVFQSRDDTQTMAISGAATTGLNGGTIYAPAAILDLSGSTQVGGPGQPSVSLIVNELNLSGATGAFQLTDGSASDLAVSTFNWITAPVLTVAAVDDTGQALDPNKIADLGDAMAYLNQALGSFGVDQSWADTGAAADVTVHFDSTTPEGDAADGVLGYTTPQNDVYLVTGWNYSTSPDPAQVAPDQFDFETLAIHELGHTVGLGESQDPNSVMYEYLAPGTARRTFTDSNLALIDTDADRFMKVANGVPTPPGASVPIAPANPTPAAPAGIAASAASLGTLVAETPEPTTISTFVPQGLYPRKAIASKSRRATRGRVADRDASARHGSIRVDVGLGEATHPTAAVRPDLIDLALAQIGTESRPAHGNRAAARLG